MLRMRLLRLGSSLLDGLGDDRGEHSGERLGVEHDVRQGRDLRCGGRRHGLGRDHRLGDDSPARSPRRRPRFDGSSVDGSGGHTRSVAVVSIDSAPGTPRPDDRREDHGWPRPRAASRPSRLDQLVGTSASCLDGSRRLGPGRLQRLVEACPALGLQRLEASAELGAARRPGRGLRRCRERRRSSFCAVRNCNVSMATAARSDSPSVRVGGRRSRQLLDAALRIGDDALDLFLGLGVGSSRWSPRAPASISARR